MSFLDKYEMAYVEFAQNESWEELVSSGIEARELKDQSQWKLGELADRVETKYGSNSIGVFATSIGVNKNSLLRYRDVYRKFKDREINPAVSFSHHLKAAGTDEPDEWVNKAYEEGWSVERLGVEIDKKRGNSDTYRKLEKCPKCGGYNNVTICKCK